MLAQIDIRSLKNFEPEKYKNDLRQSLNEWYLVIPYLDENNFEETICGFIQRINTAFDNHAPLVKLRVKNISKKIHYDDFLSSSKKDPRKTWKILCELLTSKW